MRIPHIFRVNKIGVSREYYMFRVNKISIQVKTSRSSARAEHLVARRNQLALGLVVPVFHDVERLVPAQRQRESCEICASVCTSRFLTRHKRARQ